MLPTPTDDARLKRQNEQTLVATKYFDCYRIEIMERLKMREQIVLAYVAAVVALFGYAARPSIDPSGVNVVRVMLATVIFQLLPALLAFLAMVASYSIAQHQEQIQAFSEYIALDLEEFSPRLEGRQ